MDSQKRMMLALALSFAVVTAWTLFFGPKAGPPGAGAPDGQDAGAAVAVAPAGPPGGLLPSAPFDAGVGVVLPPVVTVVREFADVHLALSTDGAGIKSAQLQGPKMRESEHYNVLDGMKHALGMLKLDSPQVDLALPVEGAPLPLAVSVDGAAPFPAGSRFEVKEQSAQKVVMEASWGEWTVRKTFEWPLQQGELSLMTVALKNRGKAPLQGDLSVRYTRQVDPSTEEKGSFFGGVGNQWKAMCRAADKVGGSPGVRRMVPVSGGGGFLGCGGGSAQTSFVGPVEFFGVDQQYFVAAVIPEVEQRAGKCELFASATERAVVASFPVTVAPDQEVTRSFQVYFGPKDSEHLAMISAPLKPGVAADPAQSPHLESAVEFGFWVVICKVLLAIMKFFFGAFHNWGVAIILLTVLVKLVLLPLTYRQLMSAEQMKKLQPQLEQIRKKWPDDKERQNVETMKLYQEAKVNPLGGCLPILVQMPVWFALFTTLRNSFEIYREPFISPLWADLTYKDPTYLLPLALGVTMILTQRLQPQVGMDPTQAKLLTYVMPGFFTLLMLNYPAGLALYIFTNNLLSIGQSYALKRYLKRKEAKR